MPRVRVITPYGFGVVSGRELATSSCEVALDEPFLNEKTLRLNPGSEIFPFDVFAVARVLNISGHGWFSNLQFHVTRQEALSRLYLPSPPDETAFFLNFTTGKAEWNRELGVLAGSVLWMQPFVDRWAAEKTRVFDDQKEALRQFRRNRSLLYGASGISASLLLDVKNGAILWFFIAVAPPQGVIFEKKFI